MASLVVVRGCIKTKGAWGSQLCAIPCKGYAAVPSKNSETRLREMNVLRSADHVSLYSPNCASPFFELSFKKSKWMIMAICPYLNCTFLSQSCCESVV